MVMVMDNDGDVGDADGDVMMVTAMAMICFTMLSLPPGSLPDPDPHIWARCLFFLLPQRLF